MNENLRKSSRNDPEPPYLPQNRRFLQENQKIARENNGKTTQKTKNTTTPYSMNRLFSELFRKFGGAFLEVCETISGGSGEVVRGKIKEK